MYEKPHQSSTYIIHTSLLFNSRTLKFDTDQSITVNPKTGRIVSVTPTPPNLSHVSYPDLDLRGCTVLPGFVDAHAHVFVHPYTETPALNQERDESLTERVLRAGNNAKAGLKAGFTTYRDLGTEGAFNADIGVRDAISRGIIPGPRLFVATEALASTGGYEIRHENKIGGTSVPRLSDVCDGVDGVKMGVRRRLGAGADVIKFYAEYRRRTLRFPQPAWPGSQSIRYPPYATGGGNAILSSMNPPSTLFDQEEMNAIVQTAKRAKCPVASHASSPEAVIMASNAGVTSIEHGSLPSEESLKAMKKNDTIYVPTLCVADIELDDKEFRKAILGHARKANEMGIRLATGGDTGESAHGNNVRELELFLEAGISLEDTLRAATLGGWEACGGDWCGYRSGWVGEGWQADLVVLGGDLREDQGALRRVEMVIKDGNVVVDGGFIIE
ncbi:hypothetical protein I302_107681 [Kwoniella bestiolae CBS 10118]|uniref:Amidohydrolase-related domain-containing protein n=1 Tax=Kwoniella bestiolae CBS 10118 TaxID=1296100 RepID=A0A1B9FXV2_9TREE|nr:hypothetical protein I302_06580 [Kwoniella bestiolae CBS 10118]OCF23597.1 hypothetical protein I302_06580 [Kwoniella bestiolae CBS 10118]